jgi:hypothetical protein
MSLNSPHGAATVRPSAGQMASQRKNVLAGNRKKQNRAQKRRAKHHAAPVVPAKTSRPVPPSTLVFDECLLRACSAHAKLACAATAATAAANAAAAAAAANAAANAAVAAADTAVAADADTTTTAAADITHATYTAEHLRALPRRELQALAKRFNIKANAKSSVIINHLKAPSSSSPCDSTETEFEQYNLPRRRTDHSAKEANESDDKENYAATATTKSSANPDANTVTHTTSAAAAKPIAAANAANTTRAAEHQREPPRSELQAPAECNNANDNATTATVIDTATSSCSLCISTETEFEQYNLPRSRTDHYTPENDDIDDKALHAAPTTETHHATLDASTVPHTKPTTAKQPRVKRGSHPAARRQRKRIAAARTAAAASESPPRPEETESEQNNLPRCSLDHYQTVTTGH